VPTSAPPSSRPGASWLLPALVFALLGGATLGLWQWEKAGLRTERETKLSRDATGISREIQDKLDLHAQFVYSLQAFVAATPELDETTWQDFSRQVLGNNHLAGVLAFSYAPRVATADLPDFVKRVRRHKDLADYRVTPPPSGEEALPVLFLSPLTPANRAALGFNLAADPARRQAIDYATRHRDIGLTGRVVLFQDQAHPRPGLILTQAVYRPGFPLSEPNQRQAALRGVVSVGYRIDELLGSLAPATGLNLSLYDATGPGTPTLLYRNGNAQPAPNALTLDYPINFGGRRWLLRFAENAGHHQALEAPPVILTGGLLISALLALLTFSLTRQRQRAQRYAQRATADLLATQAALHASDRLKQAVLDSATEIAIIATDTTGRITLFNPGAERLLGYPASTMIGHLTPLAFHLPSEVAARRQALAAELGQDISEFDTFALPARQQPSDHRVWTYVRQDGQHRQVDLVITAQRDEAGQITGYLGIALDITERQAAEAELRHQHTLLRSIIDHIPGGVSLIDADLNFIAANQRLLEILELPASLFANRQPTFHDIALFNARRGEYGPGDPEALAATILERARQGQAHLFERTRPNGRTIEVRGTPLPNGGFVTIYTDITERKQAEAELRRHRDHLQELVEERTAALEEALHEARSANRAKTEFLANMSHELRTPMHAIVNFAALGHSKLGSGQYERVGLYLERISQSSERLLNLINDLLDLSRLEVGKMVLHLHPTAVFEVIQNTVQELEPLILERQLRIDVVPLAETPRLDCDPTRLAQVMHNLLANAIKFSPASGVIRIVAEMAELPAGRRATDTEHVAALAITVSDQGKGIPEGELESIFDKFVQSSATKTGAGGTGLGLSICREIMRQHHGRIVAKNNPGGGASFTATFPIHLHSSLTRPQ